MSTKIAIIGAGSATFSLGIIRDLCLTPCKPSVPMPSATPVSGGVYRA